MVHPPHSGCLGHPAPSNDLGWVEKAWVATYDENVFYLSFLSTLRLRPLAPFHLLSPLTNQLRKIKREDEKNKERIEREDRRGMKETIKKTMTWGLMDGFGFVAPRLLQNTDLHHSQYVLVQRSQNQDIASAEQRVVSQRFLTRSLTWSPQTPHPQSMYISVFQGFPPSYHSVNLFWSKSKSNIDEPNLEI